MTRAPTGSVADSAVRTRIVEEIERSCLVEASAGTGKTTLLVQRILTLFRRGVRPEGLVAITFTEKAAAELLGRLRDDLQAAVVDPAEPDSALLAAALADLDRATVTTIHSFCSRILRDYPVAAGLAPGFQVMDAIAARRLFDETWEEWLGRELERPESRLREPLAWGARIEGGAGATGLREMARALHDQRDLFESFRSDAGDPRALQRRELARLIEGMTSRLASVERLLGACRATDDRAYVVLAELLPGQRELLDRLTADPAGEARRLMGGLKWRKIGNKGKGSNWPGDALKELREESAALVEFLEDAPMRVRGAVALEAALALDGFLAAVEEAKRRAGVVDFDDLLHGARRLLRSGAETRAALQRTFTHLLVDEFQDTDPTQAEIIFLLAADDPSESDWRKARPRPGKLFLVGDPKQSIYRFRRADITLYRECQRILEEAGGAREVIEVNFRTQGPIIDWINGVFDPLMAPEPDPALRPFRPEYSLLLPRRAEDPAPRLPAVARLKLEPDGSAASDRRVDEAGRLVTLIRRLVEGGEGRVLDRATQEWRAPLWGDIAILFRAFGSLGIYEDALREAGIPYRVDGGRLYYARSEVQGLLAVLRAVDNPNDRLSLVAALRSSFFAFTDETLLLAHAREPLCWAAASPPTDPELARAFERLSDWHRRRHELGPARLVEEILTGCRAIEFQALKRDGEQRVANLQKIADEARRFSRDAGAVRAFLRHLEERESAVGSEAEGESPIQEDGDGRHLHLLSIHKSKGLEFPIVILADPGHAVGGGTPRALFDRVGGRLALSLSMGTGLMARTPGWDDLLRDDRAQADAEAIRLLYVATTRARDQLILPLPPPGGRREGFLGLLDTWEPTAKETIEAPRDRAGDSAPVFRLEIGETATAGGECLDAVVARFNERRAGIMAALPPRPLRLYPSALGTEARWIAAGTLAPIPGATPAATMAGTELGALVHALIEADPKTPAAFESLLAARLAAGSGVACDRELVRELVAAAQASPIAARLAGARSVRREAPFLARLSLPDGRLAYLDGRVDLAFEEADGWVVVDYKTDHIPDGGVKELLERYRGQALGYALGVTRSLATREGTGRSGAPAREGIISGVKEVVFVVLRAGETHAIPVTAELLEEALARLAAAASMGTARSGAGPTGAALPGAALPGDALPGEV